MPTDPNNPPPTPVPLTPQDEHLLTALFDPDSDLLVAAAHAGLTESQLIDWTTQPHIRQRIAAHRALRRLRQEIRAEATARRTLQTLEDLAHSAEDPIERRRAATSILRYLTPQRTRPHRARSASEAPPPEPLPTPAPPASHQAPPASSPVAPASSRCEPPPSSPQSPGAPAGLNELPTLPRTPTPHSPRQPSSPNPIHTLLHAHAKTRQPPAPARPP